MKRALKPGGILIIKTDNGGNPFLACHSRYMDFTHEIIFTEHSLEQVLIAAGFKDIKIKGTDIYVLKSILNFPAKVISKFMCRLYYVRSYLFGRKTIKVFEKDLIAYARKDI